MRRVIVVIAAASCGPAPIEAALTHDGLRDVHRLADGELIVVASDDALWVAPRGCDDTPCATRLGSIDRDSFAGVRVEAFRPGWVLVHEGQRTTGDFGYGDADVVHAVALATPPRLGCALVVSSYGCNTEYGRCASSHAEILPGGDGAAFTARATRESHGVSEPGGDGVECTRYTLDARGACVASPVACP